jgi:septal ring factor EnvC (AmiA/AmiB activator)
MGDAAPELAMRAEALSGEIDSLNRLERGIRREKARLEAAEATLAVKRLEIERFALAKRAKYENVSADAKKLRSRAAALAAAAEDLRDLLSALEKDAPSLPGQKPAARIQTALNSGNTRPKPSVLQDLSNLRPLGEKEIGAMLQPVAGVVSEPFGKRRATGSRAEGITFVTRQEAQVVSPVDGVIEFSDAFRSYGHMLILRTNDNYRVIMTGLGDTFGTRGQSVTAGEPVGRMSARRNPPPELYLELRKNDRSENPAGWLER